MKTKLFITALACSAFLFTLPRANAQDNTVPPAATDVQKSPAGQAGKKHGDGAKHMEELTQAVNLTADQQAKVRELYKEAGPQMKAIRDDATLTQKDRHQKMKAIREATNTKIRALLSDEQAKKFDEFVAQKRAEHEKGGHKGKNKAQ